MTVQVVGVSKPVCRDCGTSDLDHHSWACVYHPRHKREQMIDEAVRRAWPIARFRNYPDGWAWRKIMRQPLKDHHVLRSIAPKVRAAFCHIVAEQAHGCWAIPPAKAPFRCIAARDAVIEQWTADGYAAYALNALGRA